MCYSLSCAYLNLADSVFVLSIISKAIAPQESARALCSGAALILDALEGGYTTLMRRLFILCLSNAHRTSLRHKGSPKKASLFDARLVSAHPNC